jgi:DNA-binding MarR family transcriptional regulator
MHSDSETEMATATEVATAAETATEATTEAATDIAQLLLEDDCFAIRQAARFASQLYDRHLARTGLKITQFSVMWRLALRPGMTIKELADWMVMERTTLVRAMQPLQRDGLIVSDASPRDRRALVFSLTPTGLEKVHSARGSWDRAQREFEERFGEERATFLRRELLELTKK